MILMLISLVAFVTKKIFYIFLILFSLTIMPKNASADSVDLASNQEKPVESTTDSQEVMIFEDDTNSTVEMSYWKEFIRMMVVLGIILGVVLVIAWLLKNFLNSRVKSVNENNIIKLIERRNLSQKSMLYLVEVYQKQYLIGDSSNGGIQVIAECDTLEKDLTLEQPLKANKSSFFEILQKKLSEKNFRQKVK